MKQQGLGIILTTHYMDEAERLSDELLVLSQGLTVAQGPPASVLGDMLGEHVVVVDADSGKERELNKWAGKHLEHHPSIILGEVHLPMSGTQLGQFTEKFGKLRFRVRPPNLDDLFQRLTASPRSRSSQ